MQRFKFNAKNILTTILFCSAGFGCFSQSSPAYDMMVSGVKVIVQPSGNDIMEIRTVFKGGVQNYPMAKEGIENLAIEALTECGNAKDDKNSFKDKLDKVSAEMGGSTNMDYASFNMNCISSDFDVVWPLYVAALTTPSFDPKEFERIKQDAINNLKSQSSNPDFSINKLARETAFAGSDYAKSPNGTEATVSALTVAETQAYYKSILTKSRMVIVVVGEINKETLQKKIQDMLATIPEGKPVMLKSMGYKPAKTSFSGEKKELATNYIAGITGGPDPSAPDYCAFVIANTIFYDRHFLEVRTNNGLSYAPQTRFNSGLDGYFSVLVSTKNPDKYIGVLDQLVTKTKKEGFQADEVKDAKTTYLSRFYYNMETNSSQATALATNEVVHKDWHRALTLNADLNKVTPEDVSKAFNKYVNHVTWVYQGDTSKVTPSLFAPTTEKLPTSTLKKEKTK